MQAGLLVILACLGLAGCSNGVRELPLDNVNFDDLQTVQSLGKELTPNERATLAVYALVHRPDSPNFCGDYLVNDMGEAPSTIGEAIAFTRLREARLRVAQTAVERPPSKAQNAQDRAEALADRQNVLLARRTLLFAEHGAAAESTEEWRMIERALKRNRSEMSSPQTQPGALPPG